MTGRHDLAGCRSLNEFSTVTREVAVNGGAKPSIGRCSLTIALTIKLVAPRFSNYGRAGSVMGYHFGCIF